ncbi:uncharacterized protein LOC126846670 isoform X2 [Adelges cooleyi]|nr:uncharacterized protein LOC126846670 isoform X2 [Adelges cooleyi]
MLYFQYIFSVFITFCSFQNSLLVKAGRDSNYRNENLEKRAEIHQDKIRGTKAEHILKEKLYNGALTKESIQELKHVSEVVIKHIIDDKYFDGFLKQTFSTLEQYAVDQINNRLVKLQELYKNWEASQFDDPRLKEEVRQYLEKRKATIQRKENEKDYHKKMEK